MAEEKTKETPAKSKDQNKILAVILVLILAGAVLFFMSSTKSMTNNSTPSSNADVSQMPSVQKDSELTSKKWTWTMTQMSDEQTSYPSNVGNGGSFTATFQEDGRLLATTDCNNGNGSYTIGADNSLTIGPMASTMMYCEGSSEGAYFQQLNQVGSYKIENGQLWLMLKMDSGTMIFE